MRADNIVNHGIQNVDPASGLRRVEGSRVLGLGEGLGSGQ